MQTEWKAFWLAKDLEYESDYEDAFAVDATLGRAAVSDGVSSAIFSRQWAELLTKGVVAFPPDVNDAGFWDWLADVRTQWRQTIDTANLGYFQRAKLQQCGGAFATLLWAEWTGGPGVVATWRAVAAGDCGLWHLRDGQLLHSFPIEHSDELAADPVSLCSADLGRDDAIEFRFAEGELNPGDWLMLTTDALLGWALREREAGAPPDWNEFWHMSAEDFRTRVAALRDADAIRVDDTTLVLVRFLPDPVAEDAMRASSEEIILPPAESEVEIAA